MRQARVFAFFVLVPTAAVGQPPIPAGDPPPLAVDEKFVREVWAVQPDDEKYPLPQDPKRIEAVRAARLALARANGLDLFEKTGNTKAPWADKARAALEAVAR